MTSTPLFRARHDTVDYGDCSDHTLPLLLLKKRVRPMPAIVDKRGLVTMYGRATTTSLSRVPRLSLLMRVERERKTSIRSMRRRYLAAIGVVFAAGLLAGMHLGGGTFAGLLGLLHY